VTDPTDNALELHEFHDQWFASKLAKGEDIYDGVEKWLPIKESGHYRRMKILDQTNISDIKEKVAMDFGSGPWGFGCVFPKLRDCKAGYCVDVSQQALAVSRKKDSEIAEKISYLVSDGDLIPVADNSVDIFWGGEVIEHVRSPKRFFQEIARVCKDDSLVVLSTPNRDAIYYQAQGEDNTIGPEHIALLSHDEFQLIAAGFLHSFDIFGYETSLYPNLDAVLADKHVLELIQRRAYLSPQTASGMVLIGKVSKRLYAAQQRTWRREERTSAVIARDLQLDVETKPLFGPVSGAGLPMGRKLEFALTGENIILLFWAHAWSGICRITIDNEHHDLDLYSPLGGFRRFERDGLSEASHHVSLERLGNRRPRSQSNEVIFYKAISYT
jgi:SAM-dependent methyltransferase